MNQFLHRILVMVCLILVTNCAPIPTNARLTFIENALGKPGYQSDDWNLNAIKYEKRVSQCSDSFLRDAYSFVNRRIAQSKLKEFYHFCLRKALDEQFESFGAAGWTAEKAALEKSGIIYVKHEGKIRQQRCQGVVIHDNLVLTAAHCFKDANAQKTFLGLNIGYNPLTAGQYGTFFRRYHNQRYQRIKQIHPPFKQLGMESESDYALAELYPLRNPPMPPETPLKYAQNLKAGDLLFIPLFSSDFDTRPESIDDNAFADISRNMCRVAAVLKNGLFIHTCQTLPKMSGGPIFLLETSREGEITGAIKLAGIHLRDNREALQVTKRYRRKGNYHCKPNSRKTKELLACFNVGISINSICSSLSDDKKHTLKCASNEDLIDERTLG